MFFIWTIIAWISYPDFIQNSSHYHLNLYGMLQRFHFSYDRSYDLVATFQSFINACKKINMDNPLVASFYNAFESGGYQIGGVGQVILAIVNALVNPIFSMANLCIILGYITVIITQFLIITTVLATAIFSFVFEPLFIII